MNAKGTNECYMLCHYLLCHVRSPISLLGLMLGRNSMGSLKSVNERCLEKDFTDLSIM